MIPWKPSLVLAPLLLALSSPAPALQVLEAREGETVLGKISRKEVTRIAFERGRVRKVTGNAGEFVLEKDEDRGEIFIRPASPDSTKPINLFVASDERTVGLLLQPVDLPSDTLLIRVRAASTDVAAPPGRSSRHVRTLKNLLLAMAQDARPEDMDVHETNRELGLWPGVRLTLQRTWLGASLVGEQYLLLNLGPRPLPLAERDLFKPGVAAVSLAQTPVFPGEATQVYVIRERRAHD
jgi:conjugal transfer pilus assembly protein TraK